jgi:adenylate cyclase
MAADEGERKLAAILAADVVGYTRLMADDERATVAALKQSRAVFRSRIEAHSGHVIDTAGDSVLAEFPSVVEAVQCAAEIQAQLNATNLLMPDHRRMHFRIGVNLGDVVEEDDGTIYGDGVNVAARLEGLAEPGGVMVSDDVHKYVSGKIAIDFVDAGAHEVKNIGEPVRAFSLLPARAMSGAPATPRRRIHMRRLAVMVSVIGAVLIILGLVAWQFTRPMISPPVENRTTQADDPILAIPAGPSIAVLPFDNLSGDPEKEYFVDGITEEIIAELTRFPELFVLARNLTFQFKGQAVDIRAVGQDLGAHYVVEGSVRADRDTIRVTAQMIDAKTGGHVWAETFERDLSAQSIFAVQDDITQRIVGALAGKHGLLARVGEQRAQTTRTENLDAHDCLLRAIVFHHIHTEAQHGIARDCLERAIDLDPNYVDALAELAYVYIEEYRHDWNVLPNSIERGMEVARRAVDLDRTHPAAHWAMALGYFSQNKLELFYEEAERAVALNPNDSAILHFAGHFIAPTGNWERGLALMRKAQLLNPAGPTWSHYVFVLNHYRKGEYELASERLRKVTTGTMMLSATLSLAILGQLEAQDAIGPALAHLAEVYPRFTIEIARHEFVIKRNFELELFEKIADGLRKAGVPASLPDS